MHGVRKTALLTGAFAGLLCFFKYMDISLSDEQDRLRKLTVSNIQDEQS